MTVLYTGFFLAWKRTADYFYYILCIVRLNLKPTHSVLEFRCMLILKTFFNEDRLIVPIVECTKSNFGLTI